MEKIFLPVNLHQNQQIMNSKSNIEKEADVLYLPWYMILFFMQEKGPEKLIYEIDLSGL